MKLLNSRVSADHNALLTLCDRNVTHTIFLRERIFTIEQATVYFSNKICHAYFEHFNKQW